MRVAPEVIRCKTIAQHNKNTKFLSDRLHLGLATITSVLIVQHDIDGNYIKVDKNKLGKWDVKVCK